MPEPERAAPSSEALALLTELSHRLQRIVIISGRDTDFLVSRMPMTGVHFVGNHGLEERQGSKSRLIPEAVRFKPALARATTAVARSGVSRIPGVMVEWKRAAITVHYRNVTDPKAARAALADRLHPIATREGLELQPGRLNWELRPPIDIDKGEVLRRLAAAIRPAAIVYAGDDRTDADAFSALRSIAGVTTVAAGVRSHEVPDEVFADCDVMVEGVEGATQLLAQLLDVCRDG